MLLVRNVTSWLHYLAFYNIKQLPNSISLPIEVYYLSKNEIKTLKKYPKNFQIYQSGKMLPNLVTLFIGSYNNKNHLYDKQWW